MAKLKALVTSENILLRDSDNNTLAHHAAQVGSVEMLRFLVSKTEALVEARGKWENTPLTAAIRAAKVGVVRFLLEERGADPNVRTISRLLNGSAAASMYALHLAADNGYLDIVRMLLRHGANISARDADGRTSLFSAVVTGHLKLVKYLVEWRNGTSQGANLLFVRDVNGDLPIHYAVAARRTDIVRYLARADPRQLGANNGRHSHTILHTAVLAGDVASLRVVLRYRPNLEAVATSIGADQPSSSMTALMLAASMGYEHVVRMLLDAGANDTVVDSTGNSAVHHAAGHGHTAVVRTLLNKSPRSVNLTGERSHTPLHFAIFNRHYEVVCLLLERGANLSARAVHWDSPNRTKQTGTPLLFAVAVGTPEIVHALLESGARMNEPDSRTGQFLIHLASQNGRIAVVAELLARDPCQLEWRDTRFDSTPLRTAVEANQTKMAEFLLRKGANADARLHYFDDREATGSEPAISPLNWAISNANQPLVEALLNSGADPNAAHPLGYRPLHHTLYLYYQPGAGLKALVPRLIDLLIRHGAAVESEDADGVTPTERAFVFHPDGDDFRLLVENDPQPLHRGVMKDNAALIGKAVHHLPTRLYQRNSHGETALEMAVRLGKVSMVREMIKSGLRVDTVNDGGNTLLHIAANYPNMTIRAELTEMILRNVGHELLLPLLACRNKTGVSAIDIVRPYPTLAKRLAQEGRNFTSSSLVTNVPFNIICRSITSNVYVVRSPNRKTSIETASGCQPRRINTCPRVNFLPVELINAVRAGNLAGLKTLTTDQNILLRDCNNNTLAHLAAQAGSVEILRFLVGKHKGLTEAKGEFDDTPLITATRAAKGHVVRLLLEENDADPNARARNRVRNGSVVANVDALHMAVDRGYLDIVKMLLHHGADISSRNGDGATSLHRAVATKHVEVVKYLVEWRNNGSNTSYGTDLLFMKDDSGNLPIHIAAKAGNPEVVKILVSCPSRRNATLFARNDDDELPIHNAAYIGKAAIVDILVGVDHRQLEVHGHLNRTALHIAAYKNWVVTLRTLLNYQPDLEALANYQGDHQGANPSATALILAAAKGNVGSAQMLLEAGANYTAVDCQGDSAIHVAALRGHSRVVEVLLDKNPLSANLKGNRSRTPLHCAIEEQHYEVVRVLLERGANVSAEAIWWNTDGTAAMPTATPLAFAAAKGNLQIFRALVKKGALAIETSFQNGRFPIHLAARNGYIGIMEEFLSFNKCQLELREGLYRETSLAVAINANQTAMVRYLISKGADVEAKSHYSDHLAEDIPSVSPLILAIRKLNQAMVQALLLHGADPNTGDSSGLTPLHAALKWSSRNPLASCIIEILIRHGAVAGVEDVTGETATDLAFADNPDGESFRLLVRREPFPLHRAVTKGYVVFVRKAVLHLPSRLHQRNRLGETALEMAVRLGKVEMAEAMIESGLRIDILNADGDTLLHIVANHTNATIRTQLAKIIWRDASADVLSTMLKRHNK